MGSDSAQAPNWSELWASALLLLQPGLGPQILWSLPAGSFASDGRLTRTPVSPDGNTKDRDEIIVKVGASPQKLRDVAARTGPKDLFASAGPGHKPGQRGVPSAICN